MLARNLLTEDGVVFISLDDGEIEICVKYVMKFSVSKTFLHNASENAGIAKQIYQKIYPLYTSMSFCTPRVTEIFSIKLVLISMSVIIKIPTMTLADLTKPCHVQTRVVPYIVL